MGGAKHTEALLEQYQLAVEESNVMSLGKLTPLVQMVQMGQVGYLETCECVKLENKSNKDSIILE